MRLGDALHPKQEREADGARGEAAAGGSLCLRMGWAKRACSFLLSNKCVSLLADIHRPSKPKAREGRQVNEGKSIVKRFWGDSEYDEESTGSWADCDLWSTEQFIINPSLWIDNMIKKALAKWYSFLLHHLNHITIKTKQPIIEFPVIFNNLHFLLQLLDTLFLVLNRSSVKTRHPIVDSTVPVYRTIAQLLPQKIYWRFKGFKFRSPTLLDLFIWSTSLQDLGLDIIYWSQEVFEVGLRGLVHRYPSLLCLLFNAKMVNYHYQAQPTYPYNLVASFQISRVFQLEFWCELMTYTHGKHPFRYRLY